MAEAAVRALLDEIAGEPAPRAEFVFRPELVVRGSTGAARTAEALGHEPLCSKGQLDSHRPLELNLLAGAQSARVYQQGERRRDVLGDSTR